MEDHELLRTAAERLEALAARTTPGDWRSGGLLATRPDGSLTHTTGSAARAGTAAWITALSPAVGPPLAAWLRAAADDAEAEPAAVAVARMLLERLPAD